MPFYLLKPEVAGGWGPHTRANRAVHPPQVTHLHYEFEGWSGDDLPTTFPEFIVTERLAAALEESALTGFRLAPLEISAGDMWQDLYGTRPPPPCRWLKVTGTAGQADFGLTGMAHLVVSTAALALLHSWIMANCAVHGWESGD